MWVKKRDMVLSGVLKRNLEFLKSVMINLTHVCVENYDSEKTKENVAVYAILAIYLTLLPKAIAKMLTKAPQ